MTRIPVGTIGLVSALLATGAALSALSACSSDPAAASPNRIPEGQAKTAVAAHVAELYQAAGLTPTSSVAPALAVCGQTGQQTPDYSVGTSIRFPMSSPDDAKQAITKVQTFMGAHGYTKISTVMNDSTYLVTGSIDGQTWGVDYYPNADKELRIQGGTGCNVKPDSTAPPPKST
ncbi:hypothetical protein GCM10009839_12060 [Catenulispora yoronensis]|uniref:Lipoprotein n=1 Tax=Catenulispora yoronensis TaxID=450799 RepID=A0ABP5FAK1_9ACTN